jgi:hypothetical protein
MTSIAEPLWEAYTCRFSSLHQIVGQIHKYPDLATQYDVHITELNINSGLIPSENSGYNTFYHLTNWDQRNVQFTQYMCPNRGSVIDWGTKLQAVKVAGSIPYEVTVFLNWPKPCSRTMALRSTQSLTEMSTRNLTEGKGRSARKADLTAIGEPIV